MKKVAIVITQLGKAGAETFVTELAINIDKSKFDVQIFIIEKEIDSAFKSKLINNNIRINILGLNNTSKKDRICELSKQLNAFKPDIIHANLITHRYCLKYAKQNKIKIVRTVHHQIKDEFDFKNKLILFAHYHLGRIKPVVLNEKMKKDLAKAYLLNSKKIELVNNGVDLSTFAPQNTDKKYDFVTTARLEDVKNIPLMLEAFKLCCNQNPNLTLAIAGIGSQKEIVEQKISALRLNNNVKMLGLVTDVNDLLNKSRVFILSSKTEAFPTSIIEAMACGLPIISTKCGGSESLIDGNGILVDNFNADKLGDAMYDLINNSTMQTKFSRRSIVLSKQYSNLEMARKYEQIYIKQIGEK